MLTWVQQSNEVQQYPDGIWGIPRKRLSGVFYPNPVMSIYRLHIFGATHHLISENTIDTIMVQWDHPVQPLDLIISHLSTFNDYMLDFAWQTLERDIQGALSSKTYGSSSSSLLSFSNSSSSSFSDLRCRLSLQVSPLVRTGRYDVLGFLLVLPCGLLAELFIQHGSKLRFTLTLLISLSSLRLWIGVPWDR